MTIKLIGIAGKAKAGKDTLGAYLVKHKGFKRMAFADPLKEAMAAAFGIPLAEFHDEDLKDEVHPWWMVTRRSLLQKGADAMRGQFGQDLFIQRWRLGYFDLPEPTKVVVTDIRSDAEAKAVQNAGGKVFRVVRYEAGLSGADAYHHTETGISASLVDFEIDNNGTRLEMFDLVDAILGKL